GHFWTWNVCAPSTLISRSSVLWITETPVITAMIEATPATIPTSVSTERSLLARIAWSDIANPPGRRMRRAPRRGPHRRGGPAPRDRNEHHVHHAHRAHEQRDARHDQAHEQHHAHAVVEGPDQRIELVDRKVVRRGRTQPPDRPHLARDRVPEVLERLLTRR